MEIEWYGLSWYEAINKVKVQHDVENEAEIGPLKHIFRKELIDNLKASGLEKVEQMVQTEEGKVYEPPTP